MPYIPNDDRNNLKLASYVKAASPGELNYQISTLVASYLVGQGLSYTALNDVVGVLECLKLEVYRRIAVPYEHSKMLANGDVFPPTFTQPEESS